MTMRNNFMVDKDKIVSRISARPVRNAKKNTRTHTHRPNIVFISSPLRASSKTAVRENILNAACYCRLCYDEGNIPLAPHVYLPQFLTPGNPNEDAFAERFSEFWISRSNELWCFDGNGISEGMQAEVAYAKSCGIPIRYESKGEIG